MNAKSIGVFCPIFNFARRSLNGSIRGSVTKNKRAYSLLSPGLTKNCRSTRPSIAYVAMFRYIATDLAKI